jgi:phosphoribosylformylglycinamidine synthase
VKNVGIVSRRLKASGTRHEAIGKILITNIEHRESSIISENRILRLKNGTSELTLKIDELRDVWFRTSYLLDRKQSGEKLALDRFNNYKQQPVNFNFPGSFTGKASQFGIDLKRKTSSGIKAAIIREKGVNRDRDLAWALYLAGFDVKDVHMTDLVTGRETLDDIHLIAFVGGFSNSDVLGSAKGWAGAFLYNMKAKETLDRFYKRSDTLSIGVCNGCQLLVELGLIYPDHKKQPWMSWNDSHKYECTFITLDVPENHSVMFGSLAGARLGSWSAHGEGKFNFPLGEDQYHITAKFSYSGYPGNPNGSMYDVACIASDDGRHVAIMPHIEDSVLPWQWACYPEGRNDEVTPWVEAFVNAREWIEKKAIGIRQ